MKVSIIIPVYNLADYMGKAIESCLAQDYKDIEVIVVNDGSTDNSEEVIKKYLDDDRVVYISQPNAGVSAARNAGVAKATGDYLTFLDADDYLSSDTVSKNVQLIQEQKERPVWVLFPVVRVDEDGNIKENIEDGFLGNCRYEEDEVIDPKQLYQRYISKQVAPIICAAFFAKDFFDIPSPPGRFEDTYIFLSLMRKKPNVLISSKGAYNYLDRGDSYIRGAFDVGRWMDYTRVNILKYKTAIEIMPEFESKFQYEASASYYNLIYLKNKYRKDPEYGKPLEYFIKEYGPVQEDWALSMKCKLKSFLSRILMR